MGNIGRYTGLRESSKEFREHGVKILMPLIGTSGKMKMYASNSV